MSRFTWPTDRNLQVSFQGSSQGLIILTRHKPLLVIEGKKMQSGVQNKIVFPVYSLSTSLFIVLKTSCSKENRGVVTSGEQRHNKKNTFQQGHMVFPKTTHQKSLEKTNKKGYSSQTMGPELHMYIHQSPPSIFMK